MSCARYNSLKRGACGKVKKKISWLLAAACLIIIVIVLFVDITGLGNISWLVTFKENIKWLAGIANTYAALVVFIVVLIFVIQIAMRFSISMRNATVLGIEFSLKNPDEIVKNNMRNYLCTKRTLFEINEQYDNFCEVFDSYHDVYGFFRQQLSEYENNNGVKGDVYSKLVDIIRELNVFLTKHQAHFRDWIDWRKKQDETKYIEFSILQRECPRYHELINDFNTINKSMINHARDFQVNFVDWDKDG